MLNRYFSKLVLNSNLLCYSSSLCTEMAAKNITYVTGNPKKLEETIKILGKNFPHKLTVKDIDLPEYQGEPDYIATEKCKLAMQSVKGPVIVEDASLCFNALNGMPGPYIKTFYKKLGNRGLYEMLRAYDDKSAYALCIFAYCPGPGKEVVLFEGRADGTILEPTGNEDFGWDPIFKPDGQDKTYAEMTKDLKNTLSHRSRSLAKMRDYFKVNGAGDK